MQLNKRKLISVGVLVLVFILAITPMFYLVAFVNHALGIGIPFNAVMIGLMIGLGFKARKILEQEQPGEDRDK